MENAIYLSGKISDLPEKEYKANFEAAENECRLMGYMEIINPCKLDHSQNKEWEDYMAMDITALFTCKNIYMLKNWKESKGARLEHKIAVLSGMNIFYQFSLT